MPLHTFSFMLPCLLAIPALAALAIAALGPLRGKIIRRIALVATLVCLVLAAVVAERFATEQKRLPASVKVAKSFQPHMAIIWDMVPLQTASPETSTKPAAIQFYVGLDGLNVWLIVLTAVLMTSSVLISWTAIQDRVNEYYAWLLLLETAMLGVFMSFDIVLFYVFFELTLVPLFFLIGIWGGPQRQHAARKFFIYTLAGSLITLLGVLGIVLVCYTRSPYNELTLSIPRLVELVQGYLASNSPEEIAFWHIVQIGVFLTLMAGFAIKVPLVPLHTWLPLAHVEAPTAGSVLLAGVLLKVGTYGFLRLCLPLAPDAALSLGVPLIGTLAVIGIIYGAFCSLAQDDIKKLVAYSSVSHLGLCMLGMFALNETGLSGSLLQMINHGLSTGGLFLLVGMLYERYHTRKLSDYGGMAARLKLLGCFMVFICLSSVGLPGLNGFVGEVLVLTGTWDLKGAKVGGPMLAVLGSMGLVLGAWYLLAMLRRVFFGPVKEPEHEGHTLHVRDLNGREIAALLPIAASCIAIGVYPQPFLDAAQRDLQVVAHIADQARQRAGVDQEQTAQARPQAEATTEREETR